MTLLVASGFLLGGLMFGPDLDLRSRQYQRWGWLRWLWLPYQKRLRHRSFLSHGPVIGTLLRVLYLLTFLGCVGSLGVLGWAIARQWQGHGNGAALFLETIVYVYQTGTELLFNNWPYGVALIVGIEVGAMSHSVSDWGYSFYQKLMKSSGKRKKLK